MSATDRSSYSWFPPFFTDQCQGAALVPAADSVAWRFQTPGSAGKITINLGSPPKSTYYKAKKLGDRGWFVWERSSVGEYPRRAYLSPVEIGSNIVWFANHGVDVEYLRVANSDQEMLLIHIPEQ